MAAGSAAGSSTSTRPTPSTARTSSRSPRSPVAARRRTSSTGRWASVRWAGRLRHFLAAARPPRAVVRLPPSRAHRTQWSSRGRPRRPRSSESGGGVLRLPPTSDPHAGGARAPSRSARRSWSSRRVDQAMLLAARSAVGVDCRSPSMPNDWAAAAGGVDVVIGSSGRSVGAVPRARRGGRRSTSTTRRSRRKARRRGTHATW